MAHKANPIRSFRKKAGLTQSGLADLLGRHQSDVSRWERGILAIPESILKLLRFLEISHCTQSKAMPRPHRRVSDM
jgi:transcriptional regulator with XRE-family HTH domain